MSQDNIKRIRSLRNKLHKSIKKNGLDSDETRKISDEMDILINEYYNNITIMLKFYYISKKY